MTELYRFKSLSDEPPPIGEVIIVETSSKGREQVEIKGDTCYLWRYEGRTEIPFCKVHEISAWRGCSGFDF